MRAAKYIRSQISEGKLVQLDANPPHAQSLLRSARRHVMVARTIAVLDPETAFIAAYDAVRKTLRAYLVQQGLDVSVSGGHYTTIETVKRLISNEHHGVIHPLGRLRARRNELEYGPHSTREVSTDEALRAIARADEVLGLLTELIPVLPAYPVVSHVN